MFSRLWRVGLFIGLSACRVALLSRVALVRVSISAATASREMGGYSGMSLPLVGKARMVS